MRQKEEPPKTLTGEDILKLMDGIDYKVESTKAVSESVMNVIMIVTNCSKENQFFLFRILATFVRCDEY